MRSAPVGRPRDSGVDDAILTATQDLLVESGFDLMSLEAIATTARVGKGAIYRRWSNKTELVVAAVSELAAAPDVPDTGSLRGDLVACARTFEKSTRTQAVLAGMMTAMARHPELRESARTALGAQVTRLFRTVIVRWIEAGEVSDSIDVDLVSNVFPALAFHRITALGVDLDDEFTVRTIDEILMKILL